MQSIRSPTLIYRDDPEDPSGKVLRQSQLEVRQLSLALGNDEAMEGVGFRLVVQTGIGGELVRIVETGDSETEAQAHRFGSAFLLPARAFAAEFPRRVRYLDWTAQSSAPSTPRAPH